MTLIYILKFLWNINSPKLDHLYRLSYPKEVLCNKGLLSERRILSIPAVAKGQDSCKSKQRLRLAELDALLLFLFAMGIFLLAINLFVEISPEWVPEVERGAGYALFDYVGSIHKQHFLHCYSMVSRYFDLLGYAAIL